MTGGIAIWLKADQLATTYRQKARGKFRNIWNQLFYEIYNIFSTNAIVFILFVRFFCAN